MRLTWVSSTKKEFGDGAKGTIPARAGNHQRKYDRLVRMKIMRLLVSVITTWNCTRGLK